MKRNSIIISPHCDDEYIGCSTILKKTKELIIVCDCGNERQGETDLCAKIYGIPSVYNFNMEDGKVFNDLDLLKNNLTSYLIGYTSDSNITVYLPNPWERHLDHKAVSMIGTLVCQLLNINVRYYSVWNLTTCFSDIVDIDKNAKISEFKKLYPSQSNIAERVILRFEEFLDIENALKKKGVD